MKRLLATLLAEFNHQADKARFWMMQREGGYSDVGRAEAFEHAMKFTTAKCEAATDETSKSIGSAVLSIYNLSKAVPWTVGSSRLAQDNRKIIDAEAKEILYNLWVLSETVLGLEDTDLAKHGLPFDVFNWWKDTVDNLVKASHRDSRDERS